MNGIVWCAISALCCCVQAAPGLLFEFLCVVWRTTNCTLCSATTHSITLWTSPGMYESFACFGGVFNSVSCSTGWLPDQGVSSPCYGVEFMSSDVTHCCLAWVSFRSILFCLIQLCVCLLLWQILDLSIINQFSRAQCFIRCLITASCCFFWMCSKECKELTILTRGSKITCNTSFTCLLLIGSTCWF